MEKFKPICLIAAQDNNGIIGHGIDMPGWYIADDYKKNFTPKVRGCPIIIGTQTMLSLEKMGVTLKHSMIILLTSDPDERKKRFPTAAFYASNIWEALAQAQRCAGHTTWIGGGGKVFDHVLKHVVPYEIHLTKVQASYPGENEIFFPNFDTGNYNVIHSEKFEKRPALTLSEKDKGNSDDALLCVYRRIKDL